ncbi:MAG: hypothetical protein ABMA64_07220 [Myxococcota bacterium]
MTPPPVTARSLALALVVPFVVAALAYQGLMSWRDSEDANAERNAGRVFNSKVIDVGAAEAMNRLLAQRDPTVVVLGPSYANTDVRPDLLAAKLGISKDDIALLSVPNSVGAHWYSVLKYRVFEAGYRPKLIVVVSGLQSMLLTTPLTESSFVNLEVQLPETGDPLIDQKVEHTTDLRWARIREQRGKVRAGLFDLVRDLPLVVFTPLTRVQIRNSLSRTFDDANIDMTLYGSSTPVVETERGAQQFYTPDLLPTPDASFMPDITDLATDHGARIVWVRPPMSPFIPKELDDVVLPGVQERAIELVEAKSGAFVDMRALPMTSAMFKDEDHMNVEGSRRFSQAVANALMDLDALHPAAGPGGLPPLAVTFAVDDAPPAPATPEPVTIAPGTRAVWRFEQWEPVRGTFGASVLVERDAPLAGVELAIGGRPVPFATSEGRAPLHRGIAEYPEGLPVAAPFEVAITVAAGGAPVRVSALSVGRRLRRVFVVGDADALAGRSVPLLGITHVRGGVLVDESVHPTYLAPTTKPPQHDREVLDLPDEVAAFPTPNWQFLSDEALQGESSFGSRCSPLRVTENGVELPTANVPCTEVMRKGHGRSCHTTDRIYFTAEDGSDPARNGRTYRLALDEARRCDGAAWLYPVDHFRFAFPPEQVATLIDGGAWLELGAKYLNFRESFLQVKLTVDGEVRIAERIDGRTLKTGSKVWHLDPPIPPTARDVSLEVKNEGHVFYLITTATLSEREPAH